jgi:hypothetical protein
MFIIEPSHSRITIKSKELYIKINTISPYIYTLFYDILHVTEEMQTCIDNYNNMTLSRIEKGMNFEKLFIHYLLRKCHLNLSIELTDNESWKLDLKNWIWTLQDLDSEKELINQLQINSSVVMPPIKVNEKDFDCYILHRKSKLNFHLYLLSVMIGDNHNIVIVKEVMRSCTELFKRCKEANINITNVFIYYVTSIYI